MAAITDDQADYLWKLSHGFIRAKIYQSSLKGHLECKDIFNEAIARLIESNSTVENVNSFFREIINNILREEYRKRPRGVVVNDGETFLERQEALHQASIVPVELTELVVRIYDSLKSDERSLVYARFFQGLSWKEIATIRLGGDANSEILKKEVNRLKKKLSRILARLAEHFPEGREIFYA